MAAKKFENDPQIAAAAPHNAAPEAAETDPTTADGRPGNRAVGSAPDAAAGARLPVHLQNLAETARDYAKASSADNTRKAYGSDWRHFSGWARRHGLPALPRTRKSSASMSPPAPPGRRPENPPRSPPWSGGSRR